MLEATMEAAPAAVLAQVADLSGYPAWHGMVHHVEPDGDGWLVDLGGRVGPFTKTKRVRLVRHAGDEAGRVRFVRAERDGQDHSSWELEGVVEPPAGEGPCILRFRLSYGGSSPLIGLLEPILRAEIEHSAGRLSKLLADA